MQTTEHEIRDALRRRADIFDTSTFDTSTEPPHRIDAAIRRRRTRNGMLVGLGSATLAVVVAASVFALQATGSGPASSQRAGTSTGGLAMVSYVLLDAKVATGGETSPPSWLTDHVACMRDQGFEIPDPIQTSDGWSIVVDDPAAVGLGTAAWREAAFVTCALDRPLSGDLILGISKDKLDRFVTCMAGQSYDLPAPTVDQDGEYRFDLTETDIDTARAAWDRAVFVTCSPDAAGG